MESLTILQVIAQGERLSVCHFHCVTADRSPFDSVHIRHASQCTYASKAALLQGITWQGWSQREGSCPLQHRCSHRARTSLPYITITGHVRQWHLDKEGRPLRTQNLSNQHSLGYSSRELLFVDPTVYSFRCQSYHEPSLCSLIQQCRERERASFGIARPKAYSHRDEILRGIAKLKSKEMGTKEMKKP